MKNFTEDLTTSMKVSKIGYRLSVIGYRLSVIGYRLSVCYCFLTSHKDSNHKLIIDTGNNSSVVRLHDGANFRVQIFTGGDLLCQS